MFFTLHRDCTRSRDKLQRNAAFLRRLAVEPLEQRAMLSIGPSSIINPIAALGAGKGIPAGGGAQHQTVANLPVAAQHAISSAIGQDQPAYHGTLGAEGVTLANPANGFTAQLNAGALQISAGLDTWDMSLVGLAYGGAVQPVGTASTSVNGNRVDCNYGSTDEWYVNGPGGLEQGFTVTPPLPSDGSGSLTVELALSGDLAATVNSAADGLTLTRPDGSTVLVYTGLTASDVTGKTLPSSLEVQAGGNGQLLLIHVNCSGAKGPITIDPYVEEAELTASDGVEGDFLGASVAISGNTAIVGASGANNGQGAAYIFTKPASGWADMTQTAKLTASDGMAGDDFGRSVAISGNTVVVGADLADQGQGAAYVFVQPASGWTSMTQTQTAKLTATDGAADDNFGRSVAISGNTVVVGAVGKNQSRGAAYVFVQPASGWPNATQIAELTEPNGAPNDSFGNSVAISGNTLAVGAAGAGAAYVFTEPASGWTDVPQTAELTDGLNDGFGSALAISGNTLAVVGGATKFDVEDGISQPAVYVYTEPASGWTSMTPTATLTASDGVAGKYFGWSIAISGPTIVVGEPYATSGDFVGGVYVYKEPASGWTDAAENMKFLTPGAAGDGFGASVAISGNTIVSGADQEEAGEGAAYVFAPPPPDPDLAVLAGFPSAPSGSQPVGGVIEDSHGNLFGTTESGSAYGDGAVFEIKAGSSTPTTLAYFNGTDGSSPNGLVEDSYGNLFGTTGQGGPFDDGTIFEIVAGSGTTTTIASFNGPNGVGPGGLVADASGNLFGTTIEGGPSGAGTVFEVKSGSGTITTLAAFGGSGLSYPIGGLVEDANGNFFGTAVYWVFEVKAGSGRITPLAYVPGVTSGLVEDASGDIFGTTNIGGTSGDGTVFKVNVATGIVTALASFDGVNGDQPGGRFFRDANGDLFGTTAYGGPSYTSSAPGDGTVFELKAGSGTIDPLAYFDGTNGENPTAALVEDANGNLFGTTREGGPSNDGTVFKVNVVNDAFTTLASFGSNNGASPQGGLVEDASGDLFGTTGGGGQYGDGTVFEIQAGSSTTTTLASFDGANGEDPQGNLVEDSHGNLFGTTEAGGTAGDGTVFEVPSGNGAVTTLVMFTGANGEDPQGGLVEDTSGNLFGTTNEGGGTTNDGTVFKVNAVSGTFTTLASFNGINGAESEVGLTIDSNGDLFGTTTEGGVSQLGTVFEVKASSSTIKALANFSNTNGAYPEGALVVDASGNLFGTTTEGGASDEGTVFEIKAGSGKITTLASFPANGGYSVGGLVEDASGDLFGTTEEGGPEGGGTVFEVQQGSGAITTLAYFDGANGESPEAGLVEDARGNLFGTTSSGGVSGNGTVFEIKAGALSEGPAAGSDSYAVAATWAWTATSNAPWLHTTSSGNGYGLAAFTFDANPGPTRSGTLTIAGRPVTVTQAGSGYVASSLVSTLQNFGLNGPSGVAVDDFGNVYIADRVNNAIKEWNPATQQITTLVSTELSQPFGVAVDAFGDVFIADTGNSAIEEWNALTQTLSTIVTGLNGPCGVTVDSLGNVYIADTGDGDVDEWSIATGTLSTLVSGLNNPYGVAVDALGNVYIADTGDGAIDEWNAATQTLSTVVSSGLNTPFGVAVDGSGNVYVADYGNNAIEEWNGATQTLSTRISSGLNDPVGVAVDGSGNLYIADTDDNAVKELPRAYAAIGSLTIGSQATLPQFGLPNPDPDPSVNGSFGARIAALSNGNFVVTDPTVNQDTGAVYLFNGRTGALISTLSGDNPGDDIGDFFEAVTALSNGNFVVDSPGWNGGEGAVTWVNGTTGATSDGKNVIDSANSLEGTRSTDYVGGGITALANGNYVVLSQDWNGGLGAATWVNGANGMTGGDHKNTIDVQNSLVGTTAGDAVGDAATALSNGNFVVLSPYWDGGLGAATWVNGADGTTGGDHLNAIDPQNSLVGSNPGDSVGNAGAIALTNGNYVVLSPEWGNVMGAATWVNGSNGTTGGDHQNTIDAQNSLVGSVALINADSVGQQAVALSNGNYVILSPEWSNSTGAATWGDGTVGIDGSVSPSNSLVGDNPGDRVGSDGATALTNGNYVVLSPGWGGGLGAATWVSGSTGTTGGDRSNTVDPQNSLTGSATNDNVGEGATALSNGNYVVSSPNWDSLSGAATWCDGATGTIGTVTAANSLVGNPEDEVSVQGIVALANGNYVVLSPDWNGGAGAATWGNGTTGTTGTVSQSNSLVGTMPNEYLGLNAVPLPNGDYVEVGYPGDTWVNGANGTTLDGNNSIDPQNTLFGTNSYSNGDSDIVPGPAPGSFVTQVRGEGGQVVVVLTDPNDFTFGIGQGQAVTVPSDFLAGSLSSGENVTLQSNNDIDVTDPIDVTPTGTPGNLTLQAGCNILLGANVNTAGGNLTLVASGNVELNGVFATSGTLTLNTGGSVTGGTITAAAFQLDGGTISADLTGPGGLTVTGAGKVTLVGANTYQGGTTVSSGTLSVASSSSLPAATSLTVGAGGTFIFDPSSAATPINPAAPAAAALPTNALSPSPVSPPRALAAVANHPLSAQDLQPIVVRPAAARTRSSVTAGISGTSCLARPVGSPTAERIAGDLAWLGQVVNSQDDLDQSHKKDVAILALEAVFAQYDG